MYKFNNSTSLHIVNQITKADPLHNLQPHPEPL